jgi:hypothetical protein
MLKALVIKELRESAIVIAVAGLAALWSLSALMGYLFLPIPVPFEPASGGIPFVNDGFLFLFSLVVGGLAIALGLKQSGGEARRGTYYFLLHRPATRRFIFGTKLAVGTAAVLVLGGLLIVLYAMWAATPGKVAAPFYWSMTLGAWQLGLGFVLIYLGAFLSGIRPARWFGTRLMPLLTAGVLAFIPGFQVWWLTILVVAVCVALYTACILYYANVRDY